MNLAFDVAENASRESTSFRWLINVFSVSFFLQLWMCIFSLGASSDAPFFRRLHMKPSAEGSGISKKKKTKEPVMAFSFSAEDVAGKDKKKAHGRGGARIYFRYNSQRR